MIALPYEIWRDIKGYEGLYQVSNLGTIKSVNRYVNGRDKIVLKKGRILKSFLIGRDYKQNGGYLAVTLFKDNTPKQHLVHRLIAESFISNPNNLPTVDHINRIRTDNRIENLRWADGKLQYNNSSIKDRVKESVSKPVLQYTLDMGFITEYPSAAEAERQTKIHNTSIGECCRGKRKTAGGFKWSYSTLS